MTLEILPYPTYDDQFRPADSDAARITEIDDTGGRKVALMVGLGEQAIYPQLHYSEKSPQLRQTEHLRSSYNRYLSKLKSEAQSLRFDICGNAM
jgi:hypothetical protein